MNEFFDFVTVKLTPEYVSGKTKGDFGMTGVGTYKHKNGDVRLRKIGIKFQPNFNNKEMHLSTYLTNMGEGIIKPMDDFNVGIEGRLKDLANERSIKLPPNSKQLVASAISNILCDAGSKQAFEAVPKSAWDKIEALVNEAWSGDVALKWSGKSEPYHALFGKGMIWYYDLGEVPEADYEKYSFQKSRWK